jgi:hypothetical protein
MSLLPLSQPIGRVWLRAGFEKRVPNPAKKGRENEFITLVAAD